MSDISLFFKHYERIIRMTRWALVGLWVLTCLYFLMPSLTKPVTAPPNKSKTSFKTEARDMSYVLVSPQKTIKITGQEGHYVEKNVVNLTGNVTLDTEDGTHIVSRDVRLNPETKHVDGNHPIHGKGPLGTFEADGFSLDNAGEYLCLKGQSQLVLNVAP